MNMTLGQVLLREQILTPGQIDEVLSYKVDNRIRFGDACVKLGYIDDEQLLDALGLQLHLPRVDLDNFNIDQDATSILEAETARTYRVMPLYDFSDEVTVACGDPLNVSSVDAVARITGKKVQIALASESQIMRTIDDRYSSLDQVSDSDNGESLTEQSEGDESQIMEIADTVLNDAVGAGASDIHIEHEKNSIRIRLRVDGMMQQYKRFSKNRAAALVSRYKVMSGIDIAESRKPQDGRFEFQGRGGKTVDLRVSTYPSAFGEKIVMRILDASAGSIGLDKLGFTEQSLTMWTRACKQPNGIVLVTGPTGSGKSTTLYATLQTVATVEKHVITIEDPIEYKLDGIVQGQLNERAGMTFANAMRAMLRQDPDIIMVGEMRDRETIELAVRAALTGHLVFSTLHTNDAASSFTRLFDMGSDPFLLSSTVRAVLAQRLVRKLCERCRVEYDPPLAELETIGIHTSEGKIFKVNESGCSHCNRKGYKGRSGLYELLVPGEKVKSLVNSGSTDIEIKKAALEEGLISLDQAGRELVLSGRTSIDEVKRVL